MAASNIISILINSVSGMFGGLMGDVLVTMAALISLVFLMAGYFTIRNLLVGGSGASGGLTGSRTVENLQKENIYEGYERDTSGNIGFKPQGSNHEWNGHSKGTNVVNWGSDAMPDSSAKRLN